MTPTFCYWSAWPNRHLDPFLDEAFRVGALRHVIYAQAAHMHQLGTRPPHREAERETILAGDSSWRRTVAVRLETPCDFHLFYGIDPAVSYAMSRCARQGLRYIYATESLQPRGKFEAKRMARELVYRWILRGAAGIFAVGPRAAHDFELLGYPRSQILPFTYPGPRVVRAYRPPTAPGELVYCGRLISLKGLDVLAEALQALRPRGLRLSVIGNGDDDAPLRRLAGSGFPVECHGAVSSERAQELMGQAAALVLPTRRREGWGYVVNEALALGVPAVVSDAVGAREMVVPGRTGHVFPTCDAAKLAEAILATLALHDHPASLARAVREMQGGLRPEPFTEYFLAAAGGLLSDGGPAPWPPWLAAAERLGGNEDTRWWRSWREPVAAVG